MSDEFKDPIDTTFDDWLTLYTSLQKSTVDIAEINKLFIAYQAGWLNCELWYSADDPIPEELN